MAKRLPGRSGTHADQVSLLEDLVRAVCHDVGNLLAAVRLSAHLLSIDVGETEGVSIAKDIEEASADAGALLAHVRSLLPGATLVRTPVSPMEVLGALERALKDRELGGVSLSIARGRHLPDVRIDPDALYHLLLTLVRGALQAAAPAGRVRVSARQAGRRVVLSVVDDGRRMNLDEIRRGPTPRGRELAVRVADALLRRTGGRATAENRRRGNRIDLWLPALAARSA